MTKNDPLKLPKQWKHWLRSSGLKLSHRKSRKRYEHYYFNDHEFRFMVGTSLTITMARQEGFDRWAISRIEGIHEAIPRSKDEFVNAIQQMREKGRAVVKISRDN